MQILMPLAFAAVAGLVFLVLLAQAGGVVQGEGQREAQKTVSQLAAMTADLIQQRTQLEMRAMGFEGAPDQNLISRQGNAAVQNFPGQIILLEQGTSQVLFSTLQAAPLDAVFNDILAKRTQTQFTVNAPGGGYIVAKHDLVFPQGYTVEGFFMMRESLMLAPYNEMVAQMRFYTIFGIILLAFAGGVLGRYLSSRLKVITRVVDEAEQGNKPEPLSEMGMKELSDLAASLNVLIQGPTAKDKVRQEANTDALTGLLNRRGFVQAMDDKFSKGGSAAEMSVMFLDLDGFKPINDTYGHDVGDDVLKEVAQRLQHCTREQDVLCRLGGDEFVLLFPGLKDRKVLEERADRVLAKVNEPYWVEDTRVTMGVSIGISIGPDDGKTGEELLGAADEAMYAAKKTGKNQFTFYS